MATLKTLGTFAIIIGCFAIIYPRFMHPLVLRALGLHVTPAKEEEPNQYPPHMRHTGQFHGERRPPPMPSDPKDIRQHMRPGPHPGMRAAAEMQKQQSQGPGRGMMGIVLPIYAVGICVYLIYTLFKVFNKRGKYPDPYARQSRFETDGGSGRVDRLGFPQELQGGGDQQQAEVHSFLRQKQQQRDLEDLLVKMDDTRNVSEDEMHALQKRLEETEAQMTRILQAMQVMQSRVHTVASDTVDGTGVVEGGASPDRKDDRVETVGATSQAASPQTGEVGGQAAAESSPESESFELVKNSGSATSDASPVSQTTSPSPFEHVSEEENGEGVQCSKEAEEALEGAGGREQKEEQEEVLLDRQQDVEDSGARHRKSTRVEKD